MDTREIIEADEVSEITHGVGAPTKNAETSLRKQHVGQHVVSSSASLLAAVTALTFVSVCGTSRPSYRQSC